jgi:cytochrome c551/c552
MAYCRDISGTISSTLTITDSSRLTGDVTCAVTGAPCISIGASNVTLDLNGYSITGQGDPQTGCGGASTANEFGILVLLQRNVVIRGLGIVQQFRNSGILLNNSSGGTVTSVTTSTNCATGIHLTGGAADNLIENNISIRNGSLTSPCGGICLANALRTRVRGNRTSGNGFAAQGANFGIGLPSPADVGNIIEQNTIVGNTNGIFVAPGVKGNFFRLNLINGNPSVQIALDRPSTTSGFDILNLAAAEDNAFVGNGCLTSINAPCPSVGPSFTADPNPILVTGNAIVGQTTLSWNAPGAQLVEIRIGSPNGQLFTLQGNRGTLQTGPWVSDGLTFYLQDVTGGKALTSDYTVATLVVHVKSGTTTARVFYFGRRPEFWNSGALLVLLGFSLAWVRRGRRVRTALGGAAFLAVVLLFLPPAHAQSKAQPTAQQTSATLDKMMAEHKSQSEMAQYVFDTHGCKACHTVGQNGKLGFTVKGKQTAGGFEGCIRLLTDMTVIAQTPERQRSAQQQKKASRFQEFGCTFCHQITPGRLSLTDVGTKLSHLHLGCVDVQKAVAVSAPR